MHLCPFCCYQTVHFQWLDAVFFLNIGIGSEISDHRFYDLVLNVNRKQHELNNS